MHFQFELVDLGPLYLKCLDCPWQMLICLDSALGKPEQKERLQAVVDEFWDLGLSLMPVTVWDHLLEGEEIG